MSIKSKDTLVISPNLQDYRKIWRSRLKNVITGKFMKIILFSFILIFSFNITIRLTQFKADNNVKGSAEWIKSNEVPYLSIEAADRFSLGFLEGRELALQILNLKNAIYLICSEVDIPYSYMTEQANLYLPYISNEYIEEMEGMVAGVKFGSGWLISFDDILVQNTFFDIYYGRVLPGSKSVEIESQSFGCTLLAKQASNGEVALAQNFDYPKTLKKGGLFESLSWVHIQYKECEYFGLRLGGMLSLPVGVSKNGFSSVVSIIESKIVSNYSTPTLILVRSAWEDAASMGEYVSTIKSSPQNFAWSMIAANSTDFIGVQSTPLESRFVYSNDSDQVVFTNRFAQDDWNDNYFQDEDFSLSRQNYAESLLNKAHGINEEEMQAELIDILKISEDSAEFGYRSAPLNLGTESQSATIAFFSKSYYGFGTFCSEERGNNPIF